MKTATIKDHDYKGPTRNPNGEKLARAIQRYQSIRSPEQLKRLLKTWGLA